MKRLTFLVALTLASAAAAQPQRLSEADTRQSMADYARCVVKAQPGLSSRAVVEDWDNEALATNARGVIPPSCIRAAGLVRALRFEIGNLRAALAEQMILRTPALAPSAAQLARLDRLAFRMPWPVKTIDAKGRALPAKAIAAQTRGYNNRAGLIAGQQVAECVVKADPAAVRVLFATRIASEAELAALKAIGPALPGCVPAMKKFSFDRASLRGSLAMSYYRLAMAARGVVWAGAPASAGAAN